ncbi:MAG: uroporphyrinogen-III synthase [Rhodospirillaceae bacterium]
MILNTRPLQYHADFQHALKDVGVKVVPCPVLSLLELPWSAQGLQNFDALIVTSQSAVDILERKTATRHFRVYAVGPGTAGAVRAAGYFDTVEGGGTAEQLLRVLDAASFRKALYVSAQNVSCDLSKDRPDRILRQVVYDMVPTQGLTKVVINAIRSTPRFIVPFYSPRSLQVFEALIKSHNLENSLSKAKAVVIHPRLLDDIALSWGKRLIASSPNGTGMIHAIKDSVIDLGIKSSMPEAA